MGWTGLPATQTTDWAQVDFFGQFYAALAERIAATGGPDETRWPWDGSAGAIRDIDGPEGYWPPTCKAGDDVQGMFGSVSFMTATEWDEITGTEPIAWSDQANFSIYDIQRWIVESCNKFVRTLDDAGDPIADFDGLVRTTYDYYFEMWGWSTVKSIILGGQTHFTRKYPDGMGGTTTAYGYCQPGDYFGPWIWNELYAVLKELRWTRYTDGGVYLDAADAAYKNAWGASGFNADRATAYALALADLESDCDNDIGHPYFTPDAEQATAHVQAVPGGGGWYYYLYAAKYSGVWTAEAIPTFCSRAIDWYVAGYLYEFVNEYLNFPTYVFDAQGDIIAYGNDYPTHTWKKWLTDTPAVPSETEKSSVAFNDISVFPPNWPAFDAYYEAILGYTTMARQAVVRWDVAGGFEYV